MHVLSPSPHPLPKNPRIRSQRSTIPRALWSDYPPLPSSVSTTKNNSNFEWDSSSHPARIGHSIQDEFIKKDQETRARAILMNCQMQSKKMRSTEYKHKKGEQTTNWRSVTRARARVHYPHARDCSRLHVCLPWKRIHVRKVRSFCVCLPLSVVDWDGWLTWLLGLIHFSPAARFTNLSLVHCAFLVCDAIPSQSTWICFQLSPFFLQGFYPFERELDPPSATGQAWLRRWWWNCF